VAPPACRDPPRRLPAPHHHRRRPLARRWEAGQRLAKKLLLDLYAAAKGAAAGANTHERCAAAGGVPASLVSAYRAVLSANLDGAFTAMATGLPSAAELLDDLPGADPHPGREGEKARRIRARGRNYCSLQNNNSARGRSARQAVPLAQGKLLLLSLSIY
jgi:hypothetical protein